jgi:hypothetical protein
MWAENKDLGVFLMYTHVYKCKNDTCSNCSRNWGRGMKESSGGSECKHDVFDNQNI